MKQFALLFVLLSGSFVLNAQDFCKPTSIFFDLNKSELKSKSKNSIDSLVETLNGADFILEIYGYTDTSNTDSYNRKLSQSRIDVVTEYLKKNKITPKETRTFNEGEDFTSNNLSKDAAFQRRVDIYLTLMEGSNVVFKSSVGVVIKKDVASFGDCGICALKPKMKYLQTENEANANGIDLMTDKGQRLETYGMVLFEIDTCASVPVEKRAQFETCMEVPAPSWNSRVRLFELTEQPGNDIWRQLDDSITYDPSTQTARFCSRAQRVNCDYILDAFVPGRMNLIFPEESLKGKNSYIHRIPKRAEQLFNDTVVFPDGIEAVVSYFKRDRDWYLFREPAPKVQRQFYNRDSLSPSACLIYISDYTLVSPLGTIELKVKMPNVDKVGYYNAAFDLFVPLERTAGNYFVGAMYQDGFELCYIKKERYFLEKNHAKKLKIKTKNGRSKAKLKKAYLLKKNKLSWKTLKR